MGPLTIDIGGTFTDVVFLDEETGAIRTAKSLSRPAAASESVLEAIANVGARPEEVTHLVLGSTVAINTILQRRGARTAFVTTAGFRDILEIGRGNRPDLYNFRYRKPEPFVPRARCHEVRERVAADGEVLEALREEDLDAVARACRQDGVEAIAIQFLHSYREPRHEAEAAAFLRAALPEVAVTASHEICREWGEFERASTAVFNAYLQPVVRRQFADIERALRGSGFACPLYAMQSNGGIATFAQAMAHPVTLIESGTSGGMNAAAFIAETCGEAKVIYLDIGGTTAKCAVIADFQPKIAGECWIERTRTSTGYPVRIPVVDIVEIGTGGGSIGWIDEGGVLQVGPRSAGADPAPACYDRGGVEPTLTDADLIAGLIRPDYFAEGRIHLVPERAIAAMERLSRPLGLDPHQVASSMRRIADAAMIDALRLVSVQRGHDPRDFVMVAGGGGGPLHAARLAEELGVREVIIPRHPGYVSAFGMLVTAPRRDFVKTQPVAASALESGLLARVFGELEEQARDYFTVSGPLAAGDLLFDHLIDARYVGQHSCLTLRIDPIDARASDLAGRFADEHENAFSFRLDGHEIEFVTYRLVATLRTVPPELAPPPATDTAPPERAAQERMVDLSEFGRQKIRVFARDGLPTNLELAGPALIEEPSSTTVVLPGQRFYLDELGLLHLIPAAAGAAS